MSEIGILSFLFGKAQNAEFRRRVHEQRVREKTAQFLARYRQILEDMELQGLDQYVREQVDQAYAMLAKADSLLARDPFAARSISREIAPLVGPLPRMARQIRRHQKEVVSRAEQLRRELDEQLRRFVDGVLAELIDPVERDFALEEIRTILDRYQGDTRLATDSQAFLERIRQQVETIRENARRQAEQWRLQQFQQAEQEAVTEEAQQMLDEAEKQLRQVESERAAAVLNQLRALRETLARGNQDVAEVLSAVDQAQETVQEVVLDEECRREVVRALLESLTQNGFVVDKPRRIRERDKDVVRIYARRPAGQYAAIEVTAQGDMHYEFNGYEGMACQKDIDHLIDRLRQVYNVPLSERRVVWQNPDRISKGQRPLPGTEEYRRG